MKPRFKCHASQTLHLSPFRLRFLACFFFVSAASNSWTGVSGRPPSLNTRPRGSAQDAGIFQGITRFLPLQV